MFWGATTGFIIVISLVAIFFGLKLLGHKGWILGWLRGSLGLLMLVLATLCILVAIDLNSYQQLLAEKPVITLSFEKLEEQSFKAKLVYVEEGVEKEYVLKGDQWQVDARIIRWLGVFRAMGATPAYRLDRISGRYYSLEDERRKDRTVHQMTDQQYGLDTWSWLNAHSNYVPWVDAIYGSATFLPMEDGALYQISLTHNGLVAKPLNDLATDAINRWR